MQSTWEEAHSVALRDYLEKGMSFAEIARALNERFGTAYTRNAAIGRARRLGLSVPMRERAARALNHSPSSGPQPTHWSCYSSGPTNPRDCPSVWPW